MGVEPTFAFFTQCIANEGTLPYTFQSVGNDTGNAVRILRISRLRRASQVCALSGKLSADVTMIPWMPQSVKHLRIMPANSPACAH